MNIDSTRRRRRLRAYRCRGGHCYFTRYDRCPACGGTLTGTSLPPEALLLAHTVVRVNPSGQPFKLGIVRTRSGATTLCIVHGTVRGNGRDRVLLYEQDGRFHADGRNARLSGERR